MREKNDLELVHKNLKQQFISKYTKIIFNFQILYAKKVLFIFNLNIHTKSIA